MYFIIFNGYSSHYETEIYFGSVGHSMSIGDWRHPLHIYIN